MKKVIFYLSFVLAFCQILNAKVLESRPASSFETVKQATDYLSHNSQSENLYFIGHLLDIEEDEIIDSSKNKFSLGKIALTNSSLVTSDFAYYFSRNIFSNKHFFHLQPSRFISLRVLRI